MDSLWESLSVLSHKLGLESMDDVQAASVNALSAMKFRKIFSRAIYDDLLEKIDRANQTLKTLSEQSYQREGSRRDTREWRRRMNAQMVNRRYGRELYDILIQGRCWKCPCQLEHAVCLQLDTSTVRIGGHDRAAAKAKFLMLLASGKKPPPHDSTSWWHEVEIEPDTDFLGCQVSNSAATILPDGSRLPSSRHRVHFEPTEPPNAACEMQASTESTQAIADMCTALRDVDVSRPHKAKECIGYVAQSTDADPRYNVSILRHLDQVQFQSLQDILAGSSFPQKTGCQRLKPLSRRDRLCLAVILACSIFQFHGTWLREAWSTSDILFARGSAVEDLSIDKPYLFCKVDPADCKDESFVMPGPDAMQNHILFPLGVTLIELSLGECMALSGSPDIGDSKCHLSHFHETADLLRRVYWESGCNYADVVKECLFPKKAVGLQFGDSVFEERVFESVVSPLLRDWAYFEGPAYVK
ncbi:predicted protein [Aspergillus terreus NIH2624]|uniref:DUF7580 domain-containing protein n=1 Tax=Aspergillus terreus (strain NIH 2624 / FGSC A1156) TaxID=341663 RepID=Q0CFZ7_ASPTN|nr:uncharacterized protein ATEG_07395 [Aspergillus terreus NIH2624]EAU32779.1 predicted protein [Aspergillus terreus NIH2624]